MKSKRKVGHGRRKSRDQNRPPTTVDRTEGMLVNASQTPISPRAPELNGLINVPPPPQFTQETLAAKSSMIRAEPLSFRHIRSASGVTGETFLETFPSSCSRIHPGETQGVDNGMAQSVHPRMTQAIHPGMMQSIYPNTAQDMHPGMAQGVHSGFGQGMYSGMAQGVHSGLGQGMYSGMAQRMSPGMVQGMSPGMVQGMSPGMVQGMSPGMVQGMSPNEGPGLGTGASPQQSDYTPDQYWPP